MNQEQFLLEIIESLESFADEKRKKFAQGNYPTKSRIIGVTVPQEKIVAKEIRKELSKISEKERITFLKRMMNTDIFECQHIALEYFEKDKKAFSQLTEKDLDDFAKGLDNWVLVDTYGCLLAGNMWREGMISDKKIISWLDSENFWWRRVAVVSTVSLNQKARGGKGDPIRTLMVCEKAVKDHTDLIVKALSWALRALAVQTPEPVVDFLERHKNSLHKRVIREVSNKLEKGTKN